MDARGAAIATQNAASEAAGEPPVDRGEAINQAGEQRSSRVESLRALAALAVVWGHIVAASLALNPALPSASDLGTVERIAYGGGYGVFFFFALTGYLLFWPFAKRYFGGGDSIDLGRYAVNRALRILPLYFAVVIVVLLFQENNPGLGVWARFLTFTETLSPGTAGRIVGPAWSLVVELCFYLLLPLLAYAIARLSGGSRRRAGAILIGLGLASLAIRVVTIYTADPVDPLWRLNLPATFLFFVPGMLLALVRVSWEERRPEWLHGLPARGDLWILATIPLWGLVVLGSYSLDFLVGAATFLIVGACVLPVRAGPLTNALQWRPLAIVGVASYSLYLWHVPVIKALIDGGVSTGFAALTLIAVPICLVVAIGSYAAIESPFLRLRRQWARSSAKQEPPPEPARVTA